MDRMNSPATSAARGFAVIMILFGTLNLGCGTGSVTTSQGPVKTAVLPKWVSESGVSQILVPAGDFEMGSGESDEGPRHRVQIAAFVMDQYEVLQEELTRLQIPDASHFKDPRRPVEMVRWSEAALLCNERSKAEGLTPCYDDLTFECDFEADGYRLPTEAEWEYAARAGSQDDFPPGRETKGLSARACYSGNSSKKTELAGSRRANAWGFYDLQGNVAEWCQDVYEEDYYARSPVDNPVATSDAPKRVLRGGSWKSDSDQCRITARWADEPGIDDACFAQDSYGFRMVRRGMPADEERGGNGIPESSVSIDGPAS